MVRGLHHFGGTALVVMIVIHLLQALLWGAYRAPRELTWISGIVALLVLIIISHTGFLLPNDLRAYWATQVLLGITGNQPLVGEAFGADGRFRTGRIFRQRHADAISTRGVVLLCARCSHRDARAAHLSARTVTARRCRPSSRRMT